MEEKFIVETTERRFEYLVVLYPYEVVVASRGTEVEADEIAECLNQTIIGWN